MGWHESSLGCGDLQATGTDPELNCNLGSKVSTVETFTRQSDNLADLTHLWVARLAGLVLVTVVRCPHGATKLIISYSDHPE
jgi:hypothetical protein